MKATEKPIRVVAPALRIVSEELWLAVHKRLERTRETYPGRGVRGQLHGRREAGLVSQYMLSGFLRCSCGGNLIVTSRSGRGGIKKYWICTVAHHRGKEICANVKAIPYDALTTKIIATFRESILSPNVLAAMAEDEMRRRAESPEKIKAEAEELRNEFRTLERQTARLVDAIQNGSGDLAPITEALRANERRKADVQAKLEHLDGLQQAAETFDADAWLAEQKQLLADIEQALQLSPPAARRILRICLPKPLVVSADGRGGWTFRGEGCFWERDLKKLTFELKNREIRGHLGAQPESGPLKLVAPG